MIEILYNTAHSIMLLTVWVYNPAIKWKVLWGKFYNHFYGAVFLSEITPAYKLLKTTCATTLHN